MSEYEDNAKAYEDTAAYREDIRQADTVRAIQAAADHREVIEEMQMKSADDREAALQPLQRGERVLKRLAIGVAILVFFFMAFVGGIAYDTSQKIIEIGQTNQKLNKNTEDTLSIIKSCIVPEDPGTCSEESAARTAGLISQLVCYNYTYDREFVSAAITGLNLRPEYPSPPPGCDPEKVLAEAEAKAAEARAAGQ